VLSYVKFVPSARLNSELAPLVKSTVIVFPSALSAGQAASHVSLLGLIGRSDYCHSLFFVGLQEVKVCAAQSCAAVSATAAADRRVERIIFGKVLI
jgi:hypothetical protein